MYKNNQLIKPFLADAAILPYAAVKFGADDKTVTPVTAATDSVIGFAAEQGIDAAGVAKGDSIDIVLSGIAEVTAGATIARGARLTITAAGKVQTAAPATGINANLVGIALASAASNDVIPLLIQHSTLQGA